MGWFDEQIKQRKLSDQEVFEDSFMQVAGVILGRRVIAADNVLSKVAIDDILKYFHIKPTEVKEGISDFDEALEYLLRPHGIMRRAIKLKEQWYQDAYGPILGFIKENGVPVALLPQKFFGYYYNDPESGKKIKINRWNADKISDDAICFYRPLPLKKLQIPDLLLYMRRCIAMEDVFLISVSTVLVSVVGLIAPRLTKALTGPVLNSRELSLLISIGIFMICSALSSQLIRASHSLISSRVSSKISLSVEAAVMARVLSLPAKFFREYSSGELSSRASSINSLCSMLAGFAFSLGLTSLSSLMYVSQIFSFAPSLVIPSIIIMVVSILLSVFSSLLQIKISGEQMKLAAEGSGLSYAMVTGIQKIKLSGAEKRAYSKWLNHYARETEYVYNPPLFLKINSVLITAVSLIGNIILYYIAVKTGIGQSNYFAFNSSYGLVMGAFTSLASMALSVARVRPILEMAEPILNEQPEIAENKEIITNVRGNIELSNVFFRYDEKSPYIVNNLSLKIKAGEYVAIVGKTGCGKSTLMRLLLGFEKPEKGAIYYDNKDMEKIDLKSLRQKIGTVMQSGGLFQGDIYSNITISKPTLTLDEAWEAAEIAGMADDIREMPMGMQTMISEGQGGVSGGQKQRIMIARAVAPKPKILFFDEATSALDNKTQRQVSDALDKLKCTRVVIAHRLSTI
ncbi:MAG: ATP-binding cassette domain-containing protein, partial [Erysipelotrichaceae bacterium]|nr:ATP-binding cassette domain-containing protein [Erysipelotrichaceae bacterium]